MLKTRSPISEPEMGCFLISTDPETLQCVGVPGTQTGVMCSYMDKCVKLGPCFRENTVS